MEPLEEVKFKLSINNACIQSHAITKVVFSLISKIPPNQLLPSTIKIPELEFLWNSCGDSSVVGHLCSKALANLAVNGHAKFDYILTGFQKAVPLAKELEGIVCSIGDILEALMYSQLQEKKQYQCPFSLRSPAHPLIGVLRERSDAWPHVLHVVSRFLGNKDIRSTYPVLDMLKPLLKFILLDPKCPTEFSILRFAVKQELCKSPLHSIARLKMVKFILACLPWMPKKSASEAVETTWLLQQLCDVLVDVEEDGKEVHAGYLLLIVLSQCNIMLSHGLDPSLVLHSCHDLCQNVAEELTVIHAEVSIVIIALLLPCMPLDFLPPVLAIASNILRNQTHLTPAIVAMLVLPVVHLLSTPIEEMKQVIGHTKYQNLATELLKTVEQYMSSSQMGNLTPATSDTECCELSEVWLLGISDFLNQAIVIHHLISQMDSWEESAISEWLQGVKDCSKSYSSSLTTNIISAIFVTTDSIKIVNDCLEVANLSIKEHVSQAPGWLTFLVFRLGIESDPHVKFAILESLPLLASYRPTVAPVLNTIRVLSEHPGLKAQAFHLMTQVWLHQDRSFLYLQTMLEDVGSETPPSKFGVSDVRLAMATSLREICDHSPHKHGPQVLKILSTLLNESTSVVDGPVMVLALQGVFSLCQKEVIDIRTVWKMLGNKLIRDKRPIVVRQLCKLLSLVPTLSVSTAEYDTFQQNMATLLWKIIGTETKSFVVEVAFKALSDFPLELHSLKHIPEKAKQNLQLPSSMAATPFEMAKKPEDVLSYTPGHCFIDLLRSIDDSTVLNGYGVFLSSLIQTEVKNLPRSINYMTQRRFQLPNSSPAVTDLTDYLSWTYEKNQQPALRGSLEVGILLSYKPHLMVGRDGLPSKKSLMAQGQKYEQLLGNLLQDAPLDHNEWSRCILLPVAWTSFMERAFIACEESRRLELEMQRSHGKLPGSEDEITRKLDTIWLEVRDRLTEAIKQAAKGKLTAQANCVLALSGLVATVQKYAASLDATARQQAEETVTYMSHSRWLSDSVTMWLCAIDPVKSTSENTFSWLLGHKTKLSSLGGSLIRGCAALSSCHLVPTLLSFGPSRIGSFFQHMSCQLTGETPPTIQFYYSVGLGMLIHSLFYEENTAVIGTTEEHFILPAIRSLDEFCTGEDDGELRTGPLIGLMYAVCGACHAGNQTVQKYLTSVCDNYVEKLVTNDATSVSFEVLCVCVSTMLSSVAAVNLIPLSQLEKLVSWFEDRYQQFPQCSGSTMSLGILTDALQRLGHGPAMALRHSWLDTWIPLLTTENKPTLIRLTALKGLYGLFAATKTTGLLKTNEGTTGDLMHGLNNFLKVATQILKSPRDMGLQNCCAWVAGSVTFSQNRKHDSFDAVPSNYNYLNERSILKPLVTFLLEASKKGFEETSQLQLCLTALGQDFPRPLPPINWSLVLTPFLRQNELPSLQQLAMKLCLKQASASVAAASLLATWISYPLIKTLDDNTTEMLMSNLTCMAKALPAMKLQPFMTNVVIPAAANPVNSPVKSIAVLKSLQMTLSCSDLPGKSQQLVCETLVEIAVKPDFDSAIQQQHQLCSLLCDCIIHMPDNIIKKVISSKADESALFRVVTLRCHLVSKGIKPLNWINPIIEAGKYMSHGNQNLILSILLKCLQALAATRKTNLDQYMVWLQEWMGNCSKTISEASFAKQVPAHEIMKFQLEVFSAAVLALSECDIACFLQPHMENLENLLLTSLPAGLFSLLRQQAWSQMMLKVLDWLMLLQESMIIGKETKEVLSSCTSVLRHAEEFAKASIWTNAVNF